MAGVEAPVAVRPLTQADARRIVEVYTQARNTPDLGLLDAIFHPDVVVYDCGSPEVLRGLETLKAYYRQSHAGLPDLAFEFGEPVVGGDRMATRWTLRGTHRGNLRGLPATGRTVAVTGQVIDRVVDGKVVEEWVDYDTAGLLRQLGFALVAPAGAPAP